MNFFLNFSTNLRKRTFLFSLMLTGLVWILLPKSISFQDTKGLYPVIGTMLCIVSGIVLPMVMAKFTISQSETRKVAKGEFVEVSRIITHIEHTFSRLFMCLFVTLYLFICTQLELGKGMALFKIFQEINWKIFFIFIFLVSYSLLMLYQTAPMVIVYARKYINDLTKEYQGKIVRKF
ncbi:hypothetical protein [Pelosinus sp. sgz500959]|uniref:hypothetical protein n=1 Tax=Pelosinus sp. sgz500959 TaxID=3242472 RepID=UPI00366ECA2A